MAKVSVIIPTYNRPEAVVKAVDSMLRQGYGDFEIIIIDQSPLIENRRLKEIIKANEPRVKYIASAGDNASLARNLGIQKAAGEIIICCDDDIIAEDDLIKNHAENYKDPAIGSVSGRVFCAFDIPVQKIKEVGKLRIWDVKMTANFNADFRTEVDHAYGCNVSYRRGLLVSIGGYDTRFKGTGSMDDADMSLKIRKLGYKVMFDPSAAVRHVKAAGGYRSLKFYEKMFWYYRNLTIFYLKHMYLIFLPVFLARQLSGALRRGIVSKDMRVVTYSIKGLICGIRDYMKGFLNNYKTPILGFIVSRFLIAVFSAAIVYGVPLFLPNMNFAKFNFPPFLEMWTIFDGSAYIKMAKLGYIGAGCYAWFPLYPFIMKILAFFIHSYNLSGLIISNISFLLGLCVFYRLANLETDGESAKRAVWYLSLTPFSYYFSCAYSESLFFLFCVLTFYSIKRAKWPFAGISAMLTGLTRIIGVTIYPSLIYSYIMEKKENNKKIFSPDLVYILLMLLAVSLFMGFLYAKLGNPLMFIAAHGLMGQHVSLPHVAILEGLNRSFVFFSTYSYDFSSLKGLSMALINTIYNSVEVICLFISFLLVVGVFKKFDAKYKIFSVFYLLFPLFSGRLLGWPRFIILFFPFFMYLGILGRKRILNFIILGASVVFSFVFLSAWVRHLFIA